MESFFFIFYCAAAASPPAPAFAGAADALIQIVLTEICCSPLGTHGLRGVTTGKHPAMAARPPRPHVALNKIVNRTSRISDFYLAPRSPQHTHAEVENQRFKMRGVFPQSQLTECWDILNQI